MNTNNNIQDKIDSTLNALDTLNSVQVSPFFKDKTMQKMFAEKQVTSKSWSWFTPQLQLATLVCVVIVNVYAIRQINSTKYNDAISSFASDYGLNSDSESSFLKL
ncbi:MULTISPECIES: hypothetical protein [unclassified Olleya]|jgi:hypothetical protein|uniref:hypothetical protein n=1 Tax=unclassified Olleya TaxID=2615019 RepID=UPI0011AA77C4|nr:hypothetical protein [Olleya sp. Hel_I_94]TVZ47030.1 hypothetical protein JM82_1620 [Olleya sp. Hel_I_94]|tara:strand:- start:138577 stop:138891 length:315 start_codon:yes stop_codon:yes gene_type:complete